MTVNIDEIINLLRDMNADEVKTSVNLKKNDFMYRVEITVKELWEEDSEDD